MLVAIDKPSGMTSHDVVNVVRGVFDIKKVGHGGTLDPMASGVLVVGIGRNSTKRLSEVLKMDKEYIATIKLDGKSSTDDAEGVIEEVNISKIPSEDEVKRIVKKYIGLINQIPPIFSAIKISGRPAYKYARLGQEVKMKTRKAKIYSIEITEYGWPRLRLRVRTGSGVYVRSLARDIGNDLKVGGYLVELLRTRVGEYTLDNALSLAQIENVDLI